MDSISVHTSLGDLFGSLTDDEIIEIGLDAEQRAIERAASNEDGGLDENYDYIPCERCDRRGR